MEKCAVLQRYFGYSAFRQGQETLIDGILAGRDAFGIMPTGGGKSICYQVPALMLTGITLVVSPLVSLMQDQVLALTGNGVPAAYINSTLSAEQIRTVYRNLAAGKYKLVYVAPERLDNSGFRSIASKLQISFIAVDEAHCISQWGQDFRPSYLRISHFIDALPRRPIVGAFTATATTRVREDIERLLGLRDPVSMITGFDRPNLSFEVLFPEKKDSELLRLIAARRTGSGIVYCSTRKKVEQVCTLLTERGYKATRYHAGLEEEERSANQEDFIHDRKVVMVATNAFGMGIDKSNVSYVIHYNMPKSIESYYQEAGRAGRDGTEADCILLYHDADVRTAKYLIETSEENDALDPVQREIVRRQDLERLTAMVSYCKAKTCLRGYILDYFGQKHAEYCGNCGNCKGSFTEKDITRQAQMILSCVKRVSDTLGYHAGITTTVRVLHGSKDKRVLQAGLDRLSTYGLMKNVSRVEIRSMANQLEAEGYLQTHSEQQTVSLTPKATEVLFRGQKVKMLVREAQKMPLHTAVPEMTDAEADLYDALRELRSTVAKRRHVPAYTVFSNATLLEMAKKRPTNLTAFKKISGVGELKSLWYGKDFVALIRSF